MGSSPHTRGAHPVGVNVYATAVDHPRIRGEHDYIKNAPDGMAGSSPHTRGAPTACLPIAKAAGIIPAYAGSTSVRLPVGTWVPDHPRIRGEHRCSSRVRTSLSGSSPHTRGARGPGLGVGQALGIIPAYAGSTPPPAPSRTSVWDHPRIRGEHEPSVSQPPTFLGSSPHTRGARGLDNRHFQGCRIIPAYAGSTPWTAFAPSPYAGSSPHTRGAPPQLVDEPPRARIIPAYAGSTLEPGPRYSATADHPRIRGEHPCRRYRQRLSQGSSPHTRGALGAERHGLSGVGIIPAYAGSTDMHGRHA